MQSVYKDFIYGICKLYTYIIEDVTFKQLLRLYAYTHQKYCPEFSHENSLSIIPFPLCLG